MDEPIIHERRIVIKGWKERNGNVEWWTSHHLYTERGVEVETKRIGKDLPAWQPHITEVYVEERYVTPWVRRG